MSLKNKFIETKYILNLKKISDRRFLLVILIFLTFCLANVNVSASILPSLVEKDLETGECYIVTKTVEIPTILQKADIIFAFDLTSSMGDILNTAKIEIGQVMNTLITSYPGVNFTFGVMSYMDYPDTYSSCGYNAPYGKTGDYAYSLNQSLTYITTDVITAVNNLFLGNGGDAPEDYTRIFYESYNDSNIGWRTNAVKLLVNFGDNVPHDCNLNEGVEPGTWSTGNDPGPDEEMGTTDDLDLQNVLDTMNSSGITLIECHRTSANYKYWDYWTGLTNGSVHITSSSNFVDKVIDAITSELSNLKVYNLHLKVTTQGFENWLTSVDPPSYPEVTRGKSVIFNETICVPLGTPSGLYEFNVSAIDEDGVIYGNQTNIINVNAPPNAPFNPIPKDGASGVDLNPILSVNVTDPDNDFLNVSFFDDNDNLIGIDTGVTSGDIASVSWNGLSYSTVYTWYAIANDTELINKSDIWSFTTRGPPGGGGGAPNQNPEADASESEKVGFVGEKIQFDGSLSKDSDGDILNWTWDFGDGEKGYGETTTHIYTEEGTYSVKLTIRDDDGAKDDDTITVTIKKANNPPTKPTLDGPKTGNKNFNYDFTALSYDADNDTIQYIFEWGDGETTTTGFLENGTTSFQTHNWTKYGEYLISVKAYDGVTESGPTEHTILIDVIPISNGINGYLVDENSDGTFDLFENSDNGEKTDVEKDNGNYLIDSNGDDKWDHAYNQESGLLTYYMHVYYKYFEIYQTAKNTPGFELLTLLVTITIISIILKRRRKY